MCTGSEKYFGVKPKRRFSWRQRRWFKRVGIAAAFLVGFAVAWKYLPPSMDLGNIYKQWALERQTRTPWAYFPNCDTARRFVKTPIRWNEPGYRPELDADRDGWACEPIPLWKR